MQEEDEEDILAPGFDISPDTLKKKQALKQRNSSKRSRSPIMPPSMSSQFQDIEQGRKKVSQRTTKAQATTIVSFFSRQEADEDGRGREVAEVRSGLDVVAEVGERAKAVKEALTTAQKSRQKGRSAELDPAQKDSAAWVFFRAAEGQESTNYVYCKAHGFKYHKQSVLVTVVG